ncbi:type III pantothenate kinase [Jiulongibacter sediminis]|uniref:type III pantothenate kinase n=1 Tax=Jiulongibacter sediminis TaxID=1605367 RepID=UPI0026F312A8|nr:type III pantothenate kinase [Jiulongibacter sediminis]
MIYAAIDIGNTFGKMSIYENGQETEFKRGRTSQLLKDLKKVKPDALIVCSVTLNSEELLSKFKDFEHTLFLNRDTRIPIINGYASPDTLGYDRLAAAVGAHFRFPAEDCLIIDMGTALKMDYIDKEGVFKGGYISPGLQMRFKALHTFTKKLPLLEAEEIPELIGNSTESCIKSGVINGMAAEINGIIRRYLAEHDLKILISGGDAGFFESQINYPTFAASNLVLEGLYRILIHNVENKKSTL